MGVSMQADVVAWQTQDQVRMDLAERLREAIDEQSTKSQARTGRPGIVSMVVNMQVNLIV